MCESLPLTFNLLVTASESESGQTTRSGDHF